MGSGRVIVVAVAACLAAAALTGSASAGPYSSLVAPAGTCGAAADQLNLDSTTARAAMLCLTNWARTQSGLQPLKANTALDTAGDTKLGADITCNAFTHTPCGNPFDNVFASYLAGATSYSIGENIEWGTGSYGTPRSAMDGWLNSDGHRANILNAKYSELGIGYLANQTFQGYGGATLWSQEFGTRSPAVTSTSKAPVKKATPPKRRRFLMR